MKYRKKPVVIEAIQYKKEGRMSQRIRLKLGENEIELKGEDKFIEGHLKTFIEKYVGKQRKK